MWKKGIAVLLSAIIFLNPISPISYCKADEEDWEIEGYSLDRNIEEKQESEEESTIEVQISIQETEGLGEYDSIEDITELETSVQEMESMEETKGEKSSEIEEDTKESETITLETESSIEETIYPTTSDKAESETESTRIETNTNQELGSNQQPTIELEATNNITSVQETIETGITPEKLIADMIKCEDEQNWDQYWKYWESSSHAYWQSLFQDEETMKRGECVSNVRSANLLGVAEVEVEQIPFGIRNNKAYKDITDWKAYLIAVDYTVEKVGLDWYDGVIYRIVTVGKENGEWRVVEVSEVDFMELYTLYEKCLEGKSLFDWLTEEELNIAITIREARMRGVLLDGDLSIVENISTNPNAIENYLNEKETYKSYVCIHEVKSKITVFDSNSGKSYSDVSLKLYLITNLFGEHIVGYHYKEAHIAHIIAAEQYLAYFTTYNRKYPGKSYDITTTDQAYFPEDYQMYYSSEKNYVEEVYKLAHDFHLETSLGYTFPTHYALNKEHEAAIGEHCMLQEEMEDLAKDGKNFVYILNDAYKNQTMASTYVGTPRFVLYSQLNQEWRYINGNWYYIDDEMIMEEWFTIGGEWYYFDDNGKMLTGWVKVSGKWYYLGTDGAMWHDKWLEDPSGSNTWYYFDSNGEMLSNTSKVINGKTYRFNADGVCLNP